MLRSLRSAATTLAFIAAAGCQRGGYQPAAHFAPVTSQPVSKAQAEDPAVTALIRPYHDKVMAAFPGASLGEIKTLAPVVELPVIPDEPTDEEE